MVQVIWLLQIHCLVCLSSSPCLCLVLWAICQRSDSHPSWSFLWAEFHLGCQSRGPSLSFVKLTAGWGKGKQKPWICPWENSICAWTNIFQRFVVWFRKGWGERERCLKPEVLNYNRWKRKERRGPLFDGHTVASKESLDFDLGVLLCVMAVHWIYEYVNASQSVSDKSCSERRTNSLKLSWGLLQKEWKHFSKKMLNFRIVFYFSQFYAVT